MNRANLNSVTLNSGPLSSYQRVAIALSGAAQIIFGSPLVVRGPVSVACQAAAQIVISGLDNAYTTVEIIARAVASANPTVYARQFISGAIGVIGSAIASITGHRDVREVMTPEATEQMAVNASSFSYVLVACAVTAEADVVISFDTYKQLPFDENAPEERAMIVPEDIRTMMVL